MLRWVAMRTVPSLSVVCFVLSSLVGCCSKKDESIGLPDAAPASAEQTAEAETSAPPAPLEPLEAAAPTATAEATVPKRKSDGGVTDAASPAVPPVPSLPPGFPTTLPSSLPPMPTLIPSAFPFPQPAST